MFIVYTKIQKVLVSEIYSRLNFLCDVDNFSKYKSTPSRAEVTKMVEINSRPYATSNGLKCKKTHLTSAGSLAIF